jgi:hypothetical protein
MKIKRLVLTVSFLLTMVMSFSQGGPPNGMGGPPGGWPPNCPTCPPDPTAVPVGDWKWQLGLVLCGMGFAVYTMRKKNLSTQNNKS